MDESFRQRILRLLDQHRTMRIATLRTDGWPQVTTVGYANDGIGIYCAERTVRRQLTWRGTIASRLLWMTIPRK